jgi:chromate reductase
MDKIKITAIVGSLRKDSYNRQLAMAAKKAVGDAAEFDIMEYSDVPLLNQDFEYPPPAAVRRVRDIVLGSDGIWFFTAEYNHSVPGVLKNLIDWLSRPDGPEKRRVLSKKPVAFSGISPGSFGTVMAQESLIPILSLLNVKLMNYPRLTIPKAEQQTDLQSKLELTVSAPDLERQARAFLKFIENSKA